MTSGGGPIQGLADHLTEAPGAQTHANHAPVRSGFPPEVTQP